MRQVIDATAARYLAADYATLNDARLGPSTLAWHDACAARVPALGALELLPPPSVAPIKPVLRIAAWNAERLKYAQASAALIATTRADITLLSEVDIGMARSGNRHTVRALARALEAGFVYGDTRIDWMFTRGLAASRPQTVAAVDADGLAISDHDLIMIDIEPA